MESVEYEPAWSLGAICDNARRQRGGLYDRPRQRLRLSTPSRSAIVLAMYMEVQRSAATPTAMALAWGDTHGMVEMMRKIAFREGIGDILAEGTGKAAKQLGHPEFAMARQGPGASRPTIRAASRAWASATPPRNRGACHLRGYTPAAEVVGNVLGPADEDRPAGLGGQGQAGDDLPERSHLHRLPGRLQVHHLRRVVGFVCGAVSRPSPATPCTADDLLKVGERVYNLERHYNNLNGFREGRHPAQALPDGTLHHARLRRARSASWTRCWRSTTRPAAG